MEVTKNMVHTLETNGNETEKDKTESNKEIDHDLLLSKADEFGVYQVFLFCLTFPFYIFGVFSKSLVLDTRIRKFYTEWKNKPSNT